MRISNLFRAMITLFLVWSSSAFANHVIPNTLKLTATCTDYTVDLTVGDVPDPSTLDPATVAVAVDYTLHLSNGRTVQDTISLSNITRTADRTQVVHAIKTWTPALIGTETVTQGEFSVRLRGGYVVVPAVSLPSPVTPFCGGVWGSNVVDKQVGGTMGWLTGATMRGPYSDYSPVPLYICRVTYIDGVHSGKTWPGYNKCNIGWGGSEVVLSYFEYLQASPNYQWSKTIPADRVPVVAGKANNKLVYVCHANYFGGVHPGKTWEGYNKCNIGYGGNELTLTDFEFLTLPK